MTPSEIRQLCRTHGIEYDSLSADAQAYVTVGMLQGSAIDNLAVTMASTGGAISTALARINSDLKHGVQLQVTVVGYVAAAVAKVRSLFSGLYRSVATRIWSSR